MPASARVGSRAGWRWSSRRTLFADDALQHPGEAGHDRVQVEVTRLQDLLATEQQQLPRQIRRALGSGLQLLQSLLHRRGQPLTLLHRLGLQQDHREDVVEIVRHAAGQRPMASIFCDWRSCCSSSRCSVTSRELRATTLSPQKSAMPRPIDCSMRHEPSLWRKRYSTLVEAPGLVSARSMAAATLGTSSG